ncbi:uncharacterized protein K441DRAFT_566606, partial [Cenococcum geophilum 1.58]|uniref:uncharacterized protein n=1 Tax=Cenococcum geophilum 1.58 TaxID=794803 RepID=UPI00358E23BE
RLKHSLYKGIILMPLIYNPILLILAMLVVIKAFRDYDTIKELLNIVPLEGEMLYLQWKESILNTPFFKSISVR